MCDTRATPRFAQITAARDAEAVHLTRYRSLQGVMSCETHFRKVDVGGISGQISLSEFTTALQSLGWVYNPRSAEEAFTQFVVEQVF